MLNFLKQKPKDIKELRNEVLDFIKGQLKKAESGEGENIKCVQLYVTCNAQDRFLYEGALYTENENKFKDEVQKIADDFAIELPENWLLQIIFNEPAPSDAIKSKDVDIALFISTKQKRSAHKEAVAYLKVLNGEAEQQVYAIHSSNKKINIGREKNVHVAGGYFRQNQIAFPDNSNNKSNRSISRQHAHIEWNEQSGVFYLFADEGGIPPSNKIKVKPEHEQEIKLITTEIGYQLKEGDQIILGESALLEFSYSAGDKS